MKAIVTRAYGGPEVLKLESVADPKPGPGEVLIRVVATSVNPIDFKRRDGSARSFAPIKFPGILGADVAGIIESVGPDVTGFSKGDRVFAMANHTYAELCVVKAATLAKVPDELDLVESAALPLVLTTGNELITRGTDLQPGQTILVTGAVGNVGRSAVFTAQQKGARVIAGVRKVQFKEAENLGVDQVVALDDPEEISRLPELDVVADTVGGAIGEALLGKIKPNGTYASVVGEPENAKQYPSVKISAVYAEPDTGVLISMAEAVKEHKLTIPIREKLPLAEASKGHADVEKGGAGKVILMTDFRG